MVGPYLLFLSAIALERGLELALSRRNARWAFAQGGIEYGREHFTAMKLLHASFLPACAMEVSLLERPFLAWLGYPMLGLALAAQALRYWAIASLGKRWNVRVIVVPGLDPVETGPYRWLRHPNYLAVVVEMAAVPLIHTAVLTALLYSVLNAFVLRTRIRCEEPALQEHRA